METHLTRAYSKLGVSTRAQLGTALATRSAERSPTQVGADDEDVVVRVRGGQDLRRG